MSEEKKSALPHRLICWDCAIAKGGEPEAGNTVHKSTCPYCEQEKYVSPTSDYHWPKSYGVKYIWD